MDILALREQFPQYAHLSDGDLLMGARQTYYPNMHPKVFMQAVGAPPNIHADIKKFRDQWVEGVKQPMTGEDLAQQQRRLMGSADGPAYTRPGQTETAVRSGFQGMTFGGGDEIVAGLMSMSPNRTYDQELKRERARLSAGREDHGGTAMASEIAGAIALPGAAVKSGGSAASNIWRGLVTGVGEGGLYGFLSGEDGGFERLENAFYNALLSGGVGAVTQPIMAAVRAGVDQMSIIRAVRKAAKDTPGTTPDELEQLAQRAFRAAEDEAPLPQSMLADTYTDISRSREAMPAFEPMTGNPDVRRGSAAPVTGRVLADMEDLATSPKAAGGIPYRELQNMRQRTQSGMPKTASDVELRAGGAVRQGLDDLIEDGFEAGPAVKQANDMWRRLSRHRDIQAALDKAENAASGFENGMRIEFRKILNNDKKMRGYTATEKAMIKAIANGTPWGNMMRRLSRIGPGSGGQHNVMGTMAGMAGLGMAGQQLAGPMGVAAGAMAAPVIGSLGSAMAEKSTKGMVDLMDAAVRAGIDIPQNANPNQIMQMVLGAANNFTTRGGPAGTNSAEIWEYLR